MTAATPKVGENRGNAGKGRPKGTPNKTTALLKDAILMAAKAADPYAEDASQQSIQGYLTWAAKETPGPFIGLLGKILPSEMVAAVTTMNMTKEQRDAIAAAFFRADD